ncbi:MAG: GTP-binding protein LepA [Planctomycetes bacterium SM23_32]|nr:MAG: GTP-binding protein LepA [Planctomycetes bacterium SM23_32]
MLDQTRNFCIVAHIDHGKSTLADRFLQITHAVSDREFHELMLDDMELERERGITIKASCVTMFYTCGGREYRLNLIDTPGHVDFSYEVSRSLRACEGAVLLVDANQGVEAQTVANFEQARSHGLTIVPAVTKIDLPDSRPIETMAEMEQTFGLDAEQTLAVSGKTGEGVEELLRAIVERVPPPSGDPDGPLRALVFDSFYDEYQGVVLHARVVDGCVAPGQRIRMLSSGRDYEVSGLGIFRPAMLPQAQLQCGQVGYLTAGIKDIRDVRIGDTITLRDRPAAQPLAGYREPKPVVFCGLFPQDNADLPALRSALEKLSLNDSSFVHEPEASDALGFGFRCGFLGLLHMEIIQQRLERENDIPLIQTAPNVTYEVVKVDESVVTIDRPARMPPADETAEVREPWAQLSIILPAQYIGNVIKLTEGRRGVHGKTEFLSDQRAMLVYEVPLAEVVYDFFDRLKSLTRGYGTMDYDLLGYRASDLVKVDILVNKKPVDALSVICHRADAERRGRRIVQLLRAKIERHLFPIPIQAAVGRRVVARETISPLRKDVTAKCYGGDITRKRKLLEQQKAGKKRMKSVGSVYIPQEAFLAVLDADQP